MSSHPDGFPALARSDPVHHLSGANGCASQSREQIRCNESLWQAPPRRERQRHTLAHSPFSINAARTTFHQWRINGSSLDKVAREYGLTRAAVYWHFHDKVPLFPAMGEHALSLFRDEIGWLIGRNRPWEPLNGIEAALARFFQMVDDRRKMRMVFDAIVNRYEHAAESATVLLYVPRPMTDLLSKLEFAYNKAAARGSLQPGVDSKLIALDTWVFSIVLMYQLLADDAANDFRSQVRAMNAQHMPQRRST